MRICKTKYCTTKTPKHRTICCKCISRKYRSDNPVRSSFDILRTNAKRRGKEFDLTFDQFKKFAIETEYIAGKGRSSQSFTIDRIDQDLGYTINNLQVLTNAENVKKHKKYLKYNTNESGVPDKFWVEDSKPIENTKENSPF